MNKRERVMAVIEGKCTDYVPSGFWHHFPEGYAEGEKTVKIHMDFFRNSDTDLWKVMNEHLLPNLRISDPKEWSRIKPFDKKADFIVKQVELVKRIAEEVNGEAVLLATVHGVVPSLFHATGGTDLQNSDKLALVKHLRQNPQAERIAIEAVTEILAYLAEQCLDAGADGIFYAAQGGESYTYTDEEYREFIAPGERAILQAAAGKKAFNMLHMCKDNNHLERYADYDCQVVNWGVYAGNPSLLEGRKIFPDKVILGGLDDRAGVLVDGTEDEIEKAVFELLDQMGTAKFMLGSDCTLPNEIEPSRVKLVVRAAQKYAELHK